MLRIELLGDGGIRVEPPAGAGGLASERMARRVDRQCRRAAVTPSRSPGRRRVAGARRSGRLRRGNDSPDTVRAGRGAGAVERRLDVAADGRQQWARRAGRASSSRRGRRPVAAPRAAVAVPPGDVPRTRRHARCAAPMPASRRRPGSRPPDALAQRRGAAQLPARFVRWVAIACAVAGIALAVVLRQWPFLILAAVGAVAVVGRQRW